MAHESGTVVDVVVGDVVVVVDDVVVVASVVVVVGGSVVVVAGGSVVVVVPENGSGRGEFELRIAFSRLDLAALVTATAPHTTSTGATSTVSILRIPQPPVIGTMP
jgi:hypothetical protein